MRLTFKRVTTRACWDKESTTIHKSKHVLTNSLPINLKLFRKT